MARVTGRIPASSTSAMFQAATPPESDMGSLPRNSAERSAATAMDRGYRARPERYICFPGSTPFVFAVARVFVSLTPNRLPARRAASSSRDSMGTASAYRRSFSNPCRSICT